MNDQSADFHHRARSVFMDNAPPSLMEVRNRVDREVRGTRRRDQLSALNTLARVLSIDLADVRATPIIVRTLLASRNAVELGLSERRWRNIRSSVVAAVSAFGADRSAITALVPINAQWSALLDRVETKHLRCGLHRLARFCSALQISPADVDHDVLLGFHDALVAEDLIRDPRQKLKHTIAIWNICFRRVSGWPDIKLSSPFDRDVITLPLETFQQSYQDDLSAWRENLLNPDPMDPTAPLRPLKPVTVDYKSAMIQRFASAMVHEEILPIEAISGLDVLVSDLDRFKAGLRFFLKRFDNQPNEYVAKIADTLRLLARHHVKVPDETYEAIELICKRLRPPRNEGLKANNRERLGQFDDPRNVERLLRFPQQEAERGRTLANPYRAAKCFERAVAISLLLATGLRIKNLRTLRLDSDFSFTNGRCFLSIPGERVKNGMDLDFELPADTIALLIEYRDHHRQCFPGSEGPYLFPGRDAGPRPSSTMANDIKSSLYKRAGLTMNPHLFRHAIAKIVIERDPGLAFVISRHLGHKRMNTTMQAYLGTEGRAAARHIDRVLKDAVTNPGLPEI